MKKAVLLHLRAKRGRKISMNSKLNIPKRLKDESLEEEVIRLRAENAYLKS